MPMMVRHERKGPKGSNVCNCLTDEGRPLGTGLQEQVPNHLRRLWPKAMVVNAEGNGLGNTGQVTGRKRTAREPLGNLNSDANGETTSGRTREPDEPGSGLG